ncbi:MAG TPA: rhodanese-like domain-containing protein [Bryobacteraceae bacterium]|jgi:rhodanese-related sulfurtransferase|nr:rhodanese-like domain-containing protein [Bryobacteraceae bacterium]
MDARIELTPQEFQARLAAGERCTVIDVREPGEYAIARLAESELIPMQSIPASLQRLEALADEQPLAVLCHHGVRSLNVVMWLRQQGIENCFSITGGIDRWSSEIDPSIPRY